MNRGAYAHVRMRRITGPGSESDYHLDGSNGPTVAHHNYDDACNTNNDDQPSTTEGGS